MNDYSVYIHKAPSGRVYVGISKEPQKRWNGGRDYKYNPYFWRAIQKYGWDNIEHIILESGLALSEAKEKEVELVAKYKSNSRQYGYNISGGGDGAVSEESRIKMSKARKGNNNCAGRILRKETKKKISNSLKEYYSSHCPTFSGKHHSAETIEKLKNRVFSEETKQRMRRSHHCVKGANNPSAKQVACFTIDNQYIKTYQYATVASVELHIDLSSIIKCCKGKIKTAGGYIWKYGSPECTVGLRLNRY